MDSRLQFFSLHLKGFVLKGRGVQHERAGDLLGVAPLRPGQVQRPLHRRREAVAPVGLRGLEVEGGRAAGPEGVPVRAGRAGPVAAQGVAGAGGRPAVAAVVGLARAERAGGGREG